MSIVGSEKKSDVVRGKLEEWLQNAAVGSRLMPQRELSVRFGVSVPTVRKAVEELVGTGILSRVHGSGVYVRKQMAVAQRRICIAFASSVKEVNSQFAVNARAALETEIGRRGWAVHLVSAENLNSIPADLVSSDGIVMLGDFDPGPLRNGFLVVSLFTNAYRIRNIAQITIDDFLAGMDAAEYLISLGHTRLAFVGDMVQEFHPHERYRGVCRATMAASLAEPGIIGIDGRKPCGMAAAQATADGGYTAAICANDQLAMSVISSLHKIGLGVPEDVSVIGFDDLESSAFFEPPLTTLRLPLQEGAKVALDELEQLIKDPESISRKQVNLPTDLIIRQSCGRRDA